MLLLVVVLLLLLLLLLSKLRLWGETKGSLRLWRLHGGLLSKLWLWGKATKIWLCQDHARLLLIPSTLLLVEVLRLREITLLLLLLPVLLSKILLWGEKRRLGW
jgi:hypothetical protein